jgi:AhpD family alkylhydroperoxidase
MARISLTPRRTLSLRIGEWYTRRAYGKVMEPALVFGHHPALMRGYFAFERKVSGWHELDRDLKNLAELVAAQRIGCAWCLDFGYWMADRSGTPLGKLEKALTWREQEDAFSPLERMVMEYAEAMTATPPEVTDEQVAALVAALGEAAFVELTAMVAVENLRSRVNRAVGLTSQGFSDACAVRPEALGRG